MDVLGNWPPKHFPDSQLPEDLHDHPAHFFEVLKRYLKDLLCFGIRFASSRCLGIAAAAEVKTCSISSRLPKDFDQIHAQIEFLAPLLFGFEYEYASSLSLHALSGGYRHL